MIILNDSCIGVSLFKYIEEDSIIEAITRAAELCKGDVIITSKYQESPEEFSKALLFVDVHLKPKGWPVNCLICSVNLNKIIVAIDVFLKDLSKVMDSPIFIDLSHDTGLLFTPNGNIENRKFETFFSDEIECIKVVV